jgi:hypothetical protein
MKSTGFVYAATLLLASSAAFAGKSSTVDAAVGGAIGGAVGAAVGNEIGGRDGAILGGAIGGAAGAAIATDSDGQPRGVAVQPAPAKSLPPGLAKKGKVPPGHAR